MLSGVKLVRNEKHPGPSETIRGAPDVWAKGDLNPHVPKDTGT